MSYLKSAIILFLVSVSAGFSFAQENEKIQGVWEMVSQKFDGNPSFTSGRQIKTITKNHFMFMYQDKEKGMSLLNKKTHEDTLLAYATAIGGGSGTYKFVGNTYKETIEFAGDPNYIGLSVDFTIKVQGDSLFQSGKFPIMNGSKKVSEILLEEVYKKIE